MSCLETHLVSNTAYRPEAPFYARNEDGTAVVIYIVAPGYTKEDIEITVTKEALTVSAGKKKDIPVNLYAQGFKNAFSRRMAEEDVDVLPITGENTTVSYEAGLVRIAIEIPTELHPTKLSIK